MHISSREKRRQHNEILAKRTRVEKHPDPNATKWFKQAPYYFSMGGGSNAG